MLKRENLLRMAETKGEWCVSMYMPISGIEPEKNRIRLKNLVFEAEKKLLALDVIPMKVSRLLAPIEMVLDSADFWKGRKKGFAAFFTADSFVWFSMHYKFDELVVVTDRFHLKPLVRNAAQTRNFYLLSLSQKQIKLYEASEIEINEVYLRGIPKNLATFLNSNSDEKYLQSHSGGNGAAIFHGNGAAEDDKDSKISELFRKVDKAVKNHIKDDEVPLILAGVSSLQASYKQINSYAHVLEEGINGNVDKLTPKQLLEKALPIVQPIFRQERESAMGIYQEKCGTHLASDNLNEIFKAAKDGRVETLFVPVGKQKWGKFDSKTNELRINQTAKPGDKDLLCVASTRTLQKGGKVFVVLPEQMPDRSSIAAILRY